MVGLQKLSGLNGALPTVYDPNWQRYTDLSPAQIAAFQAFPQDLAKYIALRRWQTEICSALPATGKPNYITLPNDGSAVAGIQLVTDADSQRKIAALKQALDNGAVTEPVLFVARNG